MNVIQNEPCAAVRSASGPALDCMLIIALFVDELS